MLKLHLIICRDHQRDNLKKQLRAVKSDSLRTIYVIRSSQLLHYSTIHVTGYFPHSGLYAPVKVSPCLLVSSRPTQLKALSAGLVCVTPGKHVLSYRSDSETRLESESRDLFIYLFLHINIYIKMLADDSLCVSWSFELVHVDAAAASVLTDWLVLDAEVLMSGRTSRTSPRIVDGDQS